MRSSRYQPRSAGVLCTATRGPQAGKLWPVLPLLLLQAVRVAAQTGVSVSATSLDFGTQTVHGPGAERQVSIRNQTSMPVQVGAMTNGADPQDFVPRVACNGPLPAGESCTVTVVFRPTQTGYRSAALVITTDAQAPIMVSLSGTGSTGDPGPTILCPPGRTATADPGQNSADVTTGTATAAGDDVSVTVVRSDGQALSDSYPIGTTLITWTATDRSSRQMSCVQTITVKATDQAVPIRCPLDQSVPVDSNGRSARVQPGLATSSDTGTSITGVRSDGKALGDAYPAGITTITWIATDAAGNSGTCTQTITVGSPLTLSSPATTLVDPGSANPHVDGVTPAEGPLYQRAVIHGSGFADLQGTSYVLLGGRRVTVLAWSATAIAIVLNPLAFNPEALALNAAYPLQVVTPAAGRQSNTASFSLSDKSPPRYDNSAPAGPSERPHFDSFDKDLLCPGDTVALLGSGFGQFQGTGYIGLTVPLADPAGHVVKQTFAVPVLSWSENAIRFALNLPAGAIPGTYTARVHHPNGRTASGTFTVGARNANGDCTPAH